MSIDNSEIDIIPCLQGFIGISTIQDFSERGPVQVIEKGSLEQRKHEVAQVVTFFFFLFFFFLFFFRCSLGKEAEMHHAAYGYIN